MGQNDVQAAAKYKSGDLINTSKYELSYDRAPTPRFPLLARLHIIVILRRRTLLEVRVLPEELSHYPEPLASEEAFLLKRFVRGSL